MRWSQRSGARDVEDGTVVATIGAGIVSRRERDDDLVAKADPIVIESQETAASEAGDLILSATDGKPLGG